MRRRVTFRTGESVSLYKLTNNVRPVQKRASHCTARYNRAIRYGKHNVGIVQKLHAKNYPTDEISDITGLSEAEIEKIKSPNR